MNFQRFLGLLIVAILLPAVLSANATVDVRLNHNFLDKSSSKLYVDIDVRVDERQRMNLAGQNYRIYYPSDKLSLDKDGSKSQLSPDKYSDLQFSSILEHVEALGQGALNFDGDLGFANMAVELLDNQSGGNYLSAKDGWVTIATLQFDVLGDFEEVSMIWGREGMSETYATAFVEIAEWEAPLKTQTVVIDEYIDFNLRLNSFAIEGVSYEIGVGPNPAIDFVTINADRTLESDLTATILDLSGKLVKKVLLNKGSSIYSLDVSTLDSSSYIIDLSDESGASLMSQKIVITQ